MASGIGARGGNNLNGAANLDGVILTGRAALARPKRGKAASTDTAELRAKLAATLDTEDGYFTQVTTVKPGAKVRTDAGFCTGVRTIASEMGTPNGKDVKVVFSAAEAVDQEDGSTVITRSMWLEEVA